MMNNMTDTDNTPTTTPAPAIGALIAGLAAVIMLTTFPYGEQGWTGVAGVAALVFATVNITEARRAHRAPSYMAIIGAILAAVALVCAFIVWPAIH